MRIGLPSGQVDGVADAAAGGASVDTVVPNRLAGDARAGRLQGSAAAGQHEGAGSREIAVRQAVVYLVARAVVSSRAADGHAHGGSGLKSFVHGCDGLGRPDLLPFREAPTDGEHGGLMDAVVDRGGGRGGRSEEPKA